MFGLDQLIAGLGGGNSVAFSLCLALLLGLRHATDPDHLAALTTLAARDRGGPRAGGVLGFSWGVDHAITLTAFGLPVILFHGRLPEGVYQSAEVAVGLTIMVLAVRLWRRWKHDRLHLHEHEHPGGVRHVHLHSHRHGERHGHPHTQRTPVGALAIGLVHGTGGSAGMTVLLLAATPSTPVAAVSLVVVAIGAALSMCAVSTGFGAALVSEPARRGFQRLAPLLAGGSFAFGAWYGLAGLDILAYPF